jgi:hypothetical protein
LGTEENPIIWALVPSGETDTVLTGFQSVADIIFEQTGFVIEPFVATEYAGVIEAMSADPPKAHMASLATFAYMLASERGAAEAELVSLRVAVPHTMGRSLSEPTAVSPAWLILLVRPSAVWIPSAPLAGSSPALLWQLWRQPGYGFSWCVCWFTRCCCFSCL